LPTCVKAGEPLEGTSTPSKGSSANTINETAQGDPDALAACIITTLGKAGYRIALDELGFSRSIN
jgi:hypothetical protein